MSSDELGRIDAVKNAALRTSDDSSVLIAQSVQPSFTTGTTHHFVYEIISVAQGRALNPLPSASLEGRSLQFVRSSVLLPCHQPLVIEAIDIEPPIPLGSLDREIVKLFSIFLLRRKSRAAALVSAV